MSRPATSQVLAALASGRTHHAYLVFLDFEDNPLYAWTGYGDLPWNGNTYTGVGILGQIGGATETDKLTVANSSVKLNGVPSEMLSLALSARYRRRKAKIWEALFDENGIIPDPTLHFAGRMDQMVVNEGEKTGSISLSLESSIADLDRPRVRHYTNEDQKSRYPDDTGLRYVKSLVEQDLPWGQEPNNMPTQSSGGSRPSERPEYERK